MLLGFRLTVVGLVVPGDDDSTGLGRPIEGRAKLLGVTKDDPSATLRIR